ncbi:MAG: hypothetical protein WAW13_05205 [Minisyncoccia bacterium]
MDIPDGFINEILDDLTEMSGLVLFRVTGTWASQGRTGSIDEMVIARDAIEAIERAWKTEDNRQLRTLSAEWLCPVECVKKAAWADDKPSPEEIDEKAQCDIIEAAQYLAPKGIRDMIDYLKALDESRTPAPDSP